MGEVLVQSSDAASSPPCPGAGPDGNSGPWPWVSYLRVEEQWARKCIEGSGDIDLLVRTSRGS